MGWGGGRTQEGERKGGAQCPAEIKERKKNRNGFYVRNKGRGGGGTWHEGIGTAEG